MLLNNDIQPKDNILCDAESNIRWTLTVWFFSSSLPVSSEQLSSSSAFPLGVAVLKDGGPQVSTKYSFLFLVLSHKRESQIIDETGFGGYHLFCSKKTRKLDGQETQTQ